MTQIKPADGDAMKTLTLLRHAKSGWDDAVPRDFDRPLNPKGRRAAQVMGRFLKTQGAAFDHVLASPALRVVETLVEVEYGYGRALTPAWDKRVYLASAATLLDLIRDLPEQAGTALVVGHNPGLEDLVLDLVADGGDLREAVEAKYPTAAVATMTWDGAWADLRSGAATLGAFTRPRDLDATLGPDED
jgi:phosphohistidine phosphatase